MYRVQVPRDIDGIRHRTVSKASGSVTPRVSNGAHVLALQRTAGNRAVARMVQASGSRASRICLQRVPLYHYTDAPGYNGILASQQLRPSLAVGIAHTHYGQGIYFTDLDPHFDASHLKEVGMASQFFGQLGQNNRMKMRYYFEIDVPDDLYPLQVVNVDEPRTPYSPRIWIVEQTVPMPIAGRILASGSTYFQQVADLPAPTWQQPALPLAEASELAR